MLIRREDRCRESTGRLRERHEHWGSSGFPLVHIWSDSGPFPVCVHIFSQDRFKHKGLWEVDRTCYGLAPWESFLGMCSLGVSLTSRMRNMWSLYLLFGQDSAPLCPWQNSGVHTSPASVGLSVKVPWSGAKEQTPAPKSANTTLSSKTLNSEYMKQSKQKQEKGK